MKFSVERSMCSKQPESMTQRITEQLSPPAVLALAFPASAITTCASPTSDSTWTIIASATIGTLVTTARFAVAGVDAVLGVAFIFIGHVAQHGSKHSSCCFTH